MASSDLPLPPGPWFMLDDDDNLTGMDDGTGYQWIRHAHIGTTDDDD